MEVGPQFRNMKIDKRNNFENDIVIIDGLWGSGKSLLSPIVSGMDNMVKTILVPYIDQINILIHESKLQSNDGNALITNEIDRLIYENQLGRNLNYRLFDDTGILNNPNIIKDIQKLFIKDIDLNGSEFKNSAISILTHMLLISNSSLINNNSHNIKFIEVVRNPVFAFDHWLTFLERFNQKKIFQLGYYDSEDEKFPWFSKSWIDEYKNLNKYEKAIKSMIYCYNILFNKYDEFSKNPNIIFLSFESIVYDTKKILNKISDFTSRSHNRKIYKILKKQKIPRKSIMDGLGYAKYGFQKKSSKISDIEYYNNQLLKLDKYCDPKLINKYKELINKYNLKFK
jgi:hypothetical protein